MKQLRFVILIMLSMLLLCPAARAARTPGSARAQQMRKPPAVQEVFSYASVFRIQNRSSTTFLGGTSSRDGLCRYIFMYLNDEA